MIGVQSVHVELGSKSYDIVIGEGVIDRLGEISRVVGLPVPAPCMIVTDQNVERTGLLQRAQVSLQEAGYKVGVAVIPPGESSKTFQQAEWLLDHAFDFGLDRRSVIFALGGGVVGDLAGFVAATYMRGIPFVQVPTTLLAHDSAVGGKVAVNHPRGKNIIGAFHQPKYVAYDTTALATLPAREIRSGLAEAVKHGLIWDADFLQWMEDAIEPILALEPAAISELLARSCAVKAAVVAEDEFEGNLRAILNFGHTLGHAIESLAGYGAYTHGEAVAIGMMFEAKLSVAAGKLQPPVVERMHRLLTRIGLPTELPDDLAVEDLLASMRQDKKSANGQLAFVLLCDVGRAEIVKNMEEETVVALFHQIRGERHFC